MIEEVKKNIVYAVFFSPDGIPKTSDGEWAGMISAHETVEGAERAAQRERDSGDWGDFGHTHPDHPDYDIDITSSSRGLWVEVVPVPLFGSVTRT